MVSDDLPPPDTPVTQTNFPKGNSAVTFFRLLPVAPTTVSFLPFPLRRTLGTAIARAPDTVLLNLSHGFLTGFEQFARVIEVVSQDLPDRERARQRWKRYRSAGVEPVHHDLAAR